jgi:hypothetical protein
VAAVVTLRVYTGAGAATESAAQTGIDLISADNALNSPANRTANEVVPGSNSFEKWIRLSLDSAGGQEISSFWVERTGDLPAGVIIKMGVTDTGVTPTATTSSVATMTMAEGRRYWFDAGEYGTTGEKTRYLVLQEQAVASAPSGSIDTQSFTFGWSTSSA